MTSIDGDPARFQRYQDVRDGAALLRLPLFVRAARRRLHLQRRARTTSAGAISEYFADYDRAGQAVGHRAAGSRSRSSTASTRRRPTRAAAARCCSMMRRSAPTRTAGGPQPLRPDRAAVRAARAARHRTRRRRRHADAEARRDGQLHHAEARRRAAVGRQLRVQQRRRGAAALRLAGQRLHASAPSGRTRRTCCASPTADRGSTISPTRSSGTARSASTTSSGAPGRGRMSLWPSNSAQTISFGGYTQAGAQDAGHRLLLLRPVEQRRAAAAVHHQFGAGADCAAAHQRGCRGARVLDEPEPDVAPHHRLAVRRALPQLHLRQPHAGDEHHAVRRLRLERCRRRPPAVPISTPTTGPRSTPTRPGAG